MKIFNFNSPLETYGKLNFLDLFKEGVEFMDLTQKILDPQVKQEFTKRYNARRKKIAMGMLWIGIPLIIAGGAGVGFILWSAIYYFLSGGLLQRGRFVPAKITNFNAEQGGLDYAHQLMGSLGVALIDWVGYLVPTPTRAIDIEFNKNGKTKKRHQCLLKKEEADFDQEGNGWCLIDPNGFNPLSWFVTIPQA